MKNSKFIRLSLLLLIAVASTACSDFSESKQSQTSNLEKKNTSKVDNSPYLSITYTQNKNGKDADDGMVMSSIIYDLNEKKIRRMEDIPYTSQFPLSVFLRNEKKIYYSENVSRTGDQLFFYDFNKKKKEQLTNNLFAINYILPTNTKGILVLAAATQPGGNLKTIIFDENNETMKILHEEDRDTNTWDISYNYSKDSVYTAEYSKDAQFKARELGGKLQKPTVPPNYTIKEINVKTNQERMITQFTHEQIISLSSSDTQLFVVSSQFYNQGPVEYSMVDIQSGQRTQTKLPLITRSSVYISHDQKSLYYLGAPTNNDRRGIYVFDFQTQKSTPIFIQENGFINAFSMVVN